MSNCISRVLSCVLHLSLLIPSFHHVNAQDHPVANIPSLRTNNFWPSHPSFDPAVSSLDVYDSVAYLSSLWVNEPSSRHYLRTSIKSILVPILVRVSDSASGFVCGFYCNYDCEDYVFAVLIFPNQNATKSIHPIHPWSDEPKVVWSANRNSLVRVNATLQLTEQGDLLLKEADGTTAVWSTNTSGKSVVGLNLTETGNLVLFDSNNEMVWQSFDHPTDSLLPEQTLVSGQKLTASVSEKDCSQGLISFGVTRNAVVAHVGSNPPLAYFSWPVDYFGIAIIFKNEGLFLSSGEPIWEFPPASFTRYVKLEPTGQLTFYEWIKYGWKVSCSPIFGDVDCLYPMRCGKYGICSNRQCSCPISTGEENIYFRAINHKEPDLGCSEVTPLSCGASHDQSFIELKDTLYWPAFVYSEDATDVESCKQACLTNCSCIAAMFTIFSGCSFLSEIFSLTDLGKSKELFHSTIFLKVQNLPKNPKAPSPDINPPPVPPPSSKNTGSEITVTLVSCFAALFGLFLIVMTRRSLSLRRNDAKEDEEDYLPQLPGLPTRFSYEILVAATENFSQNLGKGGFGCVFKGILSDGTKVAVKCLNGLAQTRDSFLAEVETIGSIHHLNLVKLIGYCASKSNEFLVYEYMCNGSLDQWLFHRNQELALDWKTRRKIILDIAKGLTYLHEECQKKIVHLDIKPQNILLDKNFNAKVSDFGLSKIMDRDQSQVVTTLRGTLGYLAPEWFSSAITEKADVYSFGVVTLEILCGRKNLDHARPEKDMHLLSLFKLKAEEGGLSDLVDKYSEDMRIHEAEVVEMMRVAAWCLQGDITRRPSMSAVVKVLEGVMAVKDNLDCNFFNSLAQRGMEAVGCQEFVFASPLSPSILSGPR